LQVRLIKNKDTGESKGYAFVAFKTKEDAQKAIEELKSKEFKVVLVYLCLNPFSFCSFRLEAGMWTTLIYL